MAKICYVGEDVGGKFQIKTYMYANLKTWNPIYMRGCGLGLGLGSIEDVVLGSQRLWFWVHLGPQRFWVGVRAGVHRGCGLGFTWVHRGFGLGLGLGSIEVVVLGSLGSTEVLGWG